MKQGSWRLMGRWSQRQGPRNVVALLPLADDLDDLLGTPDDYGDLL
jgi:hypothetical protein